MARVWICYNGEVYGWRDDARELARAGARFHTWCDTEYILRGYEAWGIEGLLPRVARDVRVRHRRLPHAAGPRRARPPRAEAGRLRASRRRLRVRVDRAQRAALAFARRARVLARRDRRLPRAPLRAGAADDLHEHRAVAQRASPRVRARQRSPDACIATGRRGRTRYPTAARCSTRPSSCGSSPIVRWAFSCPGGIDSRDDRVPPRGDRPSGPAFVLGRVSGVAARRERGGGGDGRARSACRTNASSCRRRSATISPRSSPRSTSRSPIRRRFRRGTSRADTERHVKVVLGGDGGDELFAGYKRIAKHLRNALARRVARCRCPCWPTRGQGLAQGRGRACARLGVGVRAALFGAVRRTSGASCSPDRRAMPAHYWRAPDSRARDRATTACCAGTSPTTCPSTCCARRICARWRTGSSCARRCSTTASSRRCSRCRPRSASPSPPKQLSREARA